MYKRLKIIVLTCIFILLALNQYFQIIPVFDNVAHDFLIRERTVSRDIVIVGMDERSMNEIGTWPWTRDYMAAAVEKLAEYEAGAVGVSVLYDMYGADERYDQALCLAAAKIDTLVLAGMIIFDETNEKQITAADYIEPFEDLSNVTLTGFMNLIPDTDGRLRNALTTVAYGDIQLHSLPFEVYRVYCRNMGIAENIVPLQNGSFPIDYAAKQGGYTRVSLWGLINDEYSAGMFKDKIVLIGPYATGISAENLYTPLERGSYTYGVEINANIIQNLIEGNFKEHAPHWLDFSVLAVLAVLVIVLTRRMKPVWVFVLTLVLSYAVFLLSRMFYTGFDIILLVGDCIIFLCLAFIADLVIDIFTAQREKQHIQGVFGRFVSPDIVKELIRGADIQLGGVLRCVTLVFVDIRGFTAFSESNPPEKVVSMVNRYLELTSSSIQKNNGTIDKYIGDATMAIFGAPNELPDHALMACRAAWAMKVGSVSLREEILRDYNVDLQFGIGVNTGYAIVGNMGSEFRMDYTAIGDAVNTAARLEANSGKGQILISDATYQLVKDHVKVEDLGILNVKNKQIGIQIYELLGV